MSEPFIAEIRIFAGNFAPHGWAFCNGQLLPVSQNTALFSLVGTTYGGDGRSTFGLPNLEGRAPMHPGRGPGLTARRLGEEGGTEDVTLSEAQMPNHRHEIVGTQERARDVSPQNNYTGAGSPIYANGNSANLVSFNQTTVPNAGGSQAHNNMQPYLTLNFIIALVGIYPPRS